MTEAQYRSVYPWQNEKTGEGLVVVWLLSFQLRAIAVARTYGPKNVSETSVGCNLLQNFHSTF